jgi:folate-dependent phosphoribosylglycinamide formyltransferase PurN
MSEQQRQLRVVLFVSESHFFQPSFVYKFLSACAGQAVVCGIVLTSVLDRNLPVHRFLPKLWLTLGTIDFLRVSARFLLKRCKTYVDRVWRLPEPPSVAAVAQRYGIEVLRTADINAPESVAWTGRHEPDVLISGCFQMFGEQLLAQPSLGSLNRHCSLLPNYRGLFPAFWAMLNGERESGVSVHLMNGELDRGPVLSQSIVPLRDGETLYEYVERCYEVSAERLTDALGLLRAGHQGRLGKHDQGDYFSYPSKNDIARFRSRGLELL